MTRRKLLSLILATSVVAPSAAYAMEGNASQKDRHELIVYIGTYAKAEEPGIYLLHFDTETGTLTKGESISGVANPSFLAIDPSHKHLYAVAEIGSFMGTPNSGGVYAFSIAPGTGTLTPLGQPQSSKGDGPCHISIDPSGKCALVANYGGGTVAVLPIGPDGKLSPASAMDKHVGGSGINKQRQDKGYAHSLNADPSGKFAIAADLGTDKLYVYHLDAAKGTLTPATPPATATHPGAGPRHFAFRADGKFAYAINELNSTVAAYRFDASKGTLTELQTLTTLPAGFTGTNSPSEVQVHPSGKFLYGANRGHNSIAVFAIDAKTGKLTSVQDQDTGGKNPRNFGIDPSGRFLIAANQDTNNLVVFRIDQKTGKLTPNGQTLELPKPVCVRFLSPGK